MLLFFLSALMNIYAEGGGHTDPPVFGAGKRSGSSYPHAKRIFGNLQQQISSASSSAASMFTQNSSSNNNNGQQKQSQHQLVPDHCNTTSQQQQGLLGKGQLLLFFYTHLYFNGPTRSIFINLHHNCMSFYVTFLYLFRSLKARKRL